MIEVGESFDEIQPNDGKDIVNAHTGLDIGLAPKRVGSGQAARSREFHLTHVDRRIVLITQSPKQEFSSDDFTELKAFEAWNLIEEEAVEKVVDIEAGIMVADEFADIHQVVDIFIIEIGLVARSDGEQGKGQAAIEVARIQRYVGEAKRGNIKAFVDIKVIGVVVILPAKEALDALGKLQGEDWPSVDDIGPAGLILEEFFMGRPTQRQRNFSRRDLTNAVELVIGRFVDVE